MLNSEAVKYLVENAIAYIRDEELLTKDRLEIAKANLETIEEFLENPDADCTKYSLDDFK